jgi:hypothetical protein
MDITLFSKKLSKISVIVDNLDAHTALNTLERDLLLSYIRDLYDLALDGKALPKHASEAKTVFTEKPYVESAKVVIATPVQQIVEISKVETILPPHPVQIVQEPIIIKESVPESIIESAIKSTPTSMSETIRELFAEEKINDMSEKLSLTPIKDLTKSMGINEKVFALQDLFANNKDHFTEVLDTLNKLPNFNEATKYLVENVIGKYDWAADKRSKHATQFIKLVRRRYN